MFQTPLQKFESNLWGFHVEVPPAIAEMFISGENRRVICTLNQSISMHSALMPSGGGWFILINKETRQKLGLDVGTPVTVGLEKDHSTYGMEMPEELQVILDQDPEAGEVFERLTAGKKRTLIYVVSKVKNVDSRIRKALAIAQHLRESGGKLDFKALNELIKFHNQSSRLY